MINVTENAKQLLKEKLQEHSKDTEMGIRLSVKEGGQFGILLDKEEEGDQVVEHQGLKVLLISSELSNHLEGKTLNVQDTTDGKKLLLA